MNVNTPFFPGFHIQTLSKKSNLKERQREQHLESLRLKNFDQLAALFSKIIPDSMLQNDAGRRTRLFSKRNTFWAYFSQLISADGGCMEVVRKAQSYAVASGKKLPSSSTSAYCQARKKLKLSDLKSIFAHVVKKAERVDIKGSLNGRRVVVVDGTGVTMPDTKDNQRCWPQSNSQKAGCGFPTARICTMFDLATGAALSFAMGNKKSAELPLFRKQWDKFHKDDIFLGDKGFCRYFDMAMLHDHAVDSVVTLARRKPVSPKHAIKKNSETDLEITWPRPLWTNKSAYSHDDWTRLPMQLKLRQIYVTVAVPGFRTKSFYIVTTLLDAEQYPAEKIADLYMQRWQVELFFRDIKTTIGMDQLRCKTPEAIMNEVIMYFIAYNSIRLIMYEAAEELEVEVDRISFKGSVQALRQWETLLHQGELTARNRRKLVSELYQAIAEKTVPIRPGRSEPRCLKRRPKPFQLLTALRSQMKETPHRDKYRANRP
jgi:hypothetical protein